MKNSLDKAYANLGFEYQESDHEYQMALLKLELKRDLQKFFGSRLRTLIKVVSRIKSGAGK